MIRVLQAGLGFVAHATVWAAASGVHESGCVASGSTSARELREQILASRTMTARPVGVDHKNFTLLQNFQWAASAGRLRVSRLRNRNVGTRMSISTVRSL